MIRSKHTQHKVEDEGQSTTLAFPLSPYNNTSYCIRKKKNIQQLPYLLQIRTTPLTCGPLGHLFFWSSAMLVPGQALNQAGKYPDHIS
jgi:hypothetical protein